VLVVTDTHFGKETTTFNTDIAKRRMMDFAGRVEEIVATLSNSYEFTDLHIFWLGDLADGAGIYPSQAHHQEITNPEQQSIDAAEQMFAPFVRRMRRSFPLVRNSFVPGNHGRTGRHAHEAANWDIACYRYLAYALKGEAGVEFDMDNIAYPIKVVDIRGWGHLLYHGNEIRSFASIPWYGMMNRLMRWYNSTLPKWHIAHMGHFHSCGRWRINQFEMFSSGTMVTHDTWAFQVLGWESANRWWLMGVSDNHPVTWAFDISTAERVLALPGELANQPPPKEEAE